jgi:hypothetical protein
MKKIIFTGFVLLFIISIDVKSQSILNELEKTINNESATEPMGIKPINNVAIKEEGMPSNLVAPGTDIETEQHNEPAPIDDAMEEPVKKSEQKEKKKEKPNDNKNMESSPKEIKAKNPE